jgi:hypothetical protein
MSRDITKQLEEYSLFSVGKLRLSGFQGKPRNGAEKADELWDGGDVPTVEEWGEFLGYCVAKYMEEKEE